MMAVPELWVILGLLLVVGLYMVVTAVMGLVEEWRKDRRRG